MAAREIGVPYTDASGERPRADAADLTARGDVGAKEQRRHVRHVMRNAGDERREVRAGRGEGARYEEPIERLRHDRSDNPTADAGALRLEAAGFRFEDQLILHVRLESSDGGRVALAKRGRAQPKLDRSHLRVRARALREALHVERAEALAAGEHRREEAGDLVFDRHARARRDAVERAARARKRAGRAG